MSHQVDANIVALKKASKTLDQMHAAQGVDVDAVVADFKAVRKHANPMRWFATNQYRRRSAPLLHSCHLSGTIDRKRSLDNGGKISLVKVSRAVRKRSIRPGAPESQSTRSDIHSAPTKCRLKTEGGCGDHRTGSSMPRTANEYFRSLSIQGTIIFGMNLINLRTVLLIESFMCRLMAAMLYSTSRSQQRHRT